MSKLEFFSPNLAEKSTITCNLQCFHLTRFAYIYRQTWSIHTYIYISHTPEVNRKSQTERRHMARRNTLNAIKMRKRWTIKHDTAIAWYVCTWHTSSVPCVHMNTSAAYHVHTSTHQQRTMCTHQHTSSVPCVHMNTNVDTPHPTPPHVPCVHINTPAAYHVYTWTHQQRTMCTHQHTSSVPCVHINTPAAYHVYTSTLQQRTMCTHEHQRWHTPPHPTYHVHTSTHQQRTMCTHEHTSRAPCVHINTPAAYHAYTSTHQQRTMCTHQRTSSVPCVHMNTNVNTPHPTPPHPTPHVPCVHINTPAAYHVYTWTPTLTHPTPPHPTPPHPTC